MYRLPSSSIIITCMAWALLIMPVIVSAQLTNCHALPPREVATTVQDLRPNDIKAVMAMGDSITTGFGVRNAVNESYGIAFSMGGDLGANTLANFLLAYNPNLQGYSKGTYAAEVCYGTNCPSIRYYPLQDVNNAAKAGSMVVDMASKQVPYLIRQVNLNPDIDVKNDWKVLTMMIGMNDLCASCTFDLPFLTADEYENNLMATLERVRAGLPRTFVNIVAGFNVSQAYDLSLTMSRCSNVTRNLFIQCDCIFKPENGQIRETIDARITQFNQRAQNVAAYYQRKAYNNFAVVVQPFAMDTHVSELPGKFLSKSDCFHPSTYGQAAMATALWNNMLTPAASKKTSINMDDTPICPTADTLLYTY